LAAARSLAGASPSLLLAIESACRVPSVALLRGGAVIAEDDAEPGRTGAESLLPSVDAVLARGGVTLDAVDAFAVSIGPGSFTGLRVGVSTVKGLAFGGEAPVVPVPTLAAVARGASAAGGWDSAVPVVALLDARRGEVYAAGFRIDASGEGARAVAPSEGVYTPAELLRVLPEGALLVGEVLEMFGDELRAAGRGQLSLGPARDAHARDVAALGAGLLAAGQGLHPGVLAPRYVRRAEAEVKRTGERFE